jgi:osmoprotectant transport system substrate-binding protein/osmoprotectant transport system permease protein
MFASGVITDLASAWERSHDTIWPQTSVFLTLTLRALGLALLAGIPGGIVLSRWRRLAGPVTAVLGLVQTIPPLVLLGLMIPLLGLGPAPALVAAIMYCLFPVVMNTYVGITEVSPSVRDAASGMGMTSRQILWQVELPLAFPVILAGVRTAAVCVSGMIVFGALVGAGGLGDYIYNGMKLNDYGLIWLGAIPVLIVTLTLFWFMSALAWLARKNSALGMSFGGGLIALLAVYAVVGLAERFWQPRRADIVVGARDFTEGQILAEIVKQRIESATNLRVEVISQLPTSASLQAMKSGHLDLYPEYTGNLLTNKEALDMPVPADKSTITAVVRQEMQRRYGLVLLDEFGLNNTYAPSVTRATAARYNLHKMSDLRRAPGLRVVIDFSFIPRPDGWNGMVETYGLHFDKPPQQLDPDLLFRALEQGEADLVIGFATAWQIQSLDLVVLEDDRGYFPSYHAAPLVRQAVLDAHPEIREALQALAGRIDDHAMRRLNYQVAVEKRSESDVAREFLEGLGLGGGAK